jgi:uncharacterized protein YjiS (DUF1127 family)
MTTTITSRVAIQARIVEWQRLYRNSDRGLADCYLIRAHAGAEAARRFWAA